MKKSDEVRVCPVKRGHFCTGCAQKCLLEATEISLQSWPDINVKLNLERVCKDF